MAHVGALAVGGTDSHTDRSLSLVHQTGSGSAEGGIRYEYAWQNRWRKLREQAEEGAAREWNQCVVPLSNALANKGRDAAEDRFEDDAGTQSSLDTVKLRRTVLTGSLGHGRVRVFYRVVNRVHRGSRCGGTLSSTHRCRAGRGRAGTRV